MDTGIEENLNEEESLSPDEKDTSGVSVELPKEETCKPSENAFISDTGRFT